MSKISDDARAMKAYIEEHGWIRGTMYGPDGSACLLGACAKTVSEKLVAKQTPIIAAIQSYVGVSYIPDWNDTIASSKEEVLSMLEDVAIKHDDDEMRIKP